VTTGSGAGVCSLWFDPAGADADTALCTPNLSEDQQQAAAALTSDILYSLTNRQWPGTCPRTVRPGLRVANNCWTWWWGPEADPWFPYLPVPYATLPRRPEPSARLRLPGPIASVTTITVDGATLTSGVDYQLVGRNVIERLGGETWPFTNDLTRAASTPRGDAADPAWAITYEWGADPPAAGLAIAEVLYCEIAAGLAGSDDCRLLWGARLTSVNRRGVSLTFESIAAFLEKGLTGVDEVDAWITAARGGPWRPRRARVRRADAPKRASRWTA